MNSPENKHETLLENAKRRGIVYAWIFLLAGLGFTALVTRYAQLATQVSLKTEFDFGCNEIRNKILDRLSAHEQILRSGAAFFEHAPGVNRQDWRRFTERQKLEQQLPGIQGIGFAKLIPRDKLAEHIQAIRAEGFPAYQLRPEGDREVYSSIIFLEPFTNRNLRAFGYDMLSEPVRRAAMEKARDKNGAVLSGKVVLVQETETDVQAGTLMYVPVYNTEMPRETVAQRRAALIGWVYSPYRMNDLMQGIMKGRNLENEQNTRLRIFDGEQVASGALLYDSQPAKDPSREDVSRLTVQTQIVSADHPWTLHFTRLDSRTSDGKVYLVLLGGVSISLLLFGLCWNLFDARFKAGQMALLAEKLRHTDNEYQRLIENSYNIIYKITVDGFFTFVSPAWSTIVGHPVDQVTGKSFSEFVHPDDLAGCQAWGKKVIETGQRQEGIEYRVRNAAGSWRWHTSSAVPLTEKDGTVIEIEGTARDITEQKRAEEQVRILLEQNNQSRLALLGIIEDETQAKANLKRLGMAVAQASEAVIITGADATIIYANPAFEKITGYSCEEAIGQNVRFLNSGKQDAAFYQQMWAVLAAGKVWKGRLINKRKDGSLYEEETSISPVRDSAGDIVNYVSVKNDVTHEVHLEAQLRQAQKMEAVGRLAGGVAHDFNNLLMGIMGYTDLCRDSIEPDHPIRNWLNEIMRTAERSTEITRQLLAFARKQIIVPRVLDLNEAVSGMLKLLQKMIGEDLNLVWRPSVNLRPVRIDPSQVDQILANLCVNARDAIAGVGTITLETENCTISADDCIGREETSPGEYVVLSVGDDGCGMGKATLAQIFEPFFTTKGIGKGTGLGLATVYGIVQQNKGFVDVCSELGNGTTFKIYLPQVAEEGVEPTVAIVAKPPQSRGETVLLVEDEQAPRVICLLFLESLDYKVLVAETPAEALSIAGRHTGDIDLLLTDVVMPGMDGRQLAERISTIKPGIKVLFMSGYTADVIAQRGVLDGGVNFLSKPFVRDGLARKVREVLDSDMGTLSGHT